MASFSKTPSSDNEKNSIPNYSAENIDIRLYDNIAVLTFKLVAKQQGKVIQSYFNTGTLTKRDNHWQAVAWQATKIPSQATAE
jgi:hypothetical protein